jgi:hypothetical protein
MTGQPNNPDLGNTDWQRIAAGYGLGHDDRARETQPVAAQLGERFYPRQLEGTVQESWQECRRHAENLRLIRSLDTPTAATVPTPPSTSSASTAAHPVPRDLLGERITTDLFGDEVATRRSMRR